MNNWFVETHSVDCRGDILSVSATERSMRCGGVGAAAQIAARLQRVDFIGSVYGRFVRRFASKQNPVAS